MKRTSLLIAAGVLTASSIFAQTLNVASGSVVYSFNAQEMGEATFSGSDSFEILGREFKIADVTGIYTADNAVESNTVKISYNDDSANVVVSGDIARYVSPSVNGAHVSLAQSSEVADNTCGEITYILSGNSSNGSFTLEGSYKATLELQGLTLHNPSGAAIDIQNGKRIELSVKKDTKNILSDGTDGSWKAALYCKGHLELKGKGVLDITGNTAHAISAKEYVEMKNCTINVLGSIKDGINCTQYFLLESGELNISGVGDDGIQVDFKDADNREAEDTGTATIAGGKLKISVTAAAAKGIKTEGDIIITGGELDMTVSGKGTYDTKKLKTKASSCLGADGNVILSGGTLNLKATGSGGKGISCDGTFTHNAGATTTISTSGGIFAYVNGREYDGYTGNTDNLDSDAKSSPKGVKADTAIVINGGTINVSTTGKGGEGIESKGTLTINDGNITVRAYDDAINSSSHMYIEGGEICVISTDNDGLDSNGNLYMRGGHVMAFGARSPECGIDAAEEQGYTVIFTGGTLLAAGGGNSTPTKTESTQPYVSTSATLAAGNTVTLKSGNEVLATFTIPADYTSGSSSTGGGFGPGGWGGMGSGSTTMLITCPGLANGSSYTLTNGSSTSTLTARTQGTGTGRPR